MHANLPKEGFAGAIIDDETGKSLEFRHLINMGKYCDIWMKSFANELGGIAQGIRDVTGTDTIDFIPHTDVPVGTTVTYGRIVCMYPPQKTEKHCMRLTVGGNLFIYIYDVSSPTSDITTEKTALQLSHFHSRITFHNNQFFKLLPQNTFAPAKVHEDENRYPP